MAITSIGYDGSITETPWAKLATALGSEYGVMGAGDWAVTAKPAADRTVRIATGSGWGHGVLSTSDAIVELQLGTIASGSRYDMIVMRRAWGTNTAAFVVLPGSAALAPPARNNDPGTLDDQPIAFVQVTAGQTQPTAIIDARVWQANGGCVARNALPTWYLTRPGTRIRVLDSGPGVHLTRIVNAGGAAVWEWEYTQAVGVKVDNVRGALVGIPPVGATFYQQAGYENFVTASDGAFNLNFPAAFGSGVLGVQATLYTGIGVQSAVPALLVGVARGALSQYAPSLSRVSFRLHQTNGAIYPNAAIGVAWTAVGW